jgi:hypothetical protein
LLWKLTQSVPPFLAPGLIARSRRKSNRELEQFSVDEFADRAESLTENLNSSRSTNLPGRAESLTENLNSFRLAILPTLYFISFSFGQVCSSKRRPKPEPGRVYLSRTPADACEHPFFPHHCPCISSPGYVGAQVSVALRPKVSSQIPSRIFGA